jgi:protein TonB
VFLEAATLQRAERRAADRLPAADAQAGTGSPRPPRGSTALLPMLATGIAVAILAIGGWLLLRDDDASDAPPGATGAATGSATAEVTTVLARADAAFAAGNLVAADGSSAAELYRQALRLEADSAVAADGFERAIEAALTGAEQALLAGEIEQSRVTAELVHLIVPDSSRLDFLYTQIERELARLDADTTQREVLAARRAQIRAAVDAVAERIAAGALLEPATDSAVSRFREAQTVGGGDPLVRGSRDALVGALLTAADSELDAGRIAGAGRLVDAAGSVNSSASGLDIMRRRVDAALAPNPPASARTESNPPPVVVVADPPPAPAPLPTPLTPPAATMTPDVAPDVAPEAEAVVSAARLQALRRVDPEFPPSAAQRMVSGWVEMEFTVATDGSVKDVIVTESEPRRTFDAAALSAMRRYRYEPMMRDGQPVEQRARLRMRFTAEER